MATEVALVLPCGWSKVARVIRHSRAAVGEGETTVYRECLGGLSDEGRSRQERVVKEWKVTTITFFALGGAVWGFISMWALFQFSLQTPTPDLPGVIRALLVAPAWGTFLVMTISRDYGVSVGDSGLLVVPVLLGALSGLLVGGLVASRL